MQETPYCPDGSLNWREREERRKRREGEGEGRKEGENGEIGKKKKIEG